MMAKKKNNETKAETPAADAPVAISTEGFAGDGPLVKGQEFTIPAPDGVLSAASAPAAPKIAWPDPTPEMLQSAAFEAVWQRIKGWDINVPGAYSGYMGGTGNHVRAILEALLGALDSAGDVPRHAADFEAGREYERTLNRAIDKLAPSATGDDLREIRRTIETLVYGCHSTREREDAARPLIEVLDKLIGA